MPRKRVRHGMNLSIIIGLTLVVIGLGLIGLYYVIDEDNVISEFFDENGDQDEDQDEDTGTNDTGDTGINYSDSIIFVIDDDIPNIDEFYGQTLEVQVFQIPYDRYIFGIDAYLKNETTPWAAVPFNVTYQIRDGLYENPRTNSSGIIYESYKTVYIEEPQWVTFPINSDLRLLNNTDYYFYLDLFSIQGDQDYRWALTYDSVNGNNATYNYALGGLGNWVNYTIYEVDFLMTLNLSAT